MHEVFVAKTSQSDLLDLLVLASKDILHRHGDFLLQLYGDLGVCDEDVVTHLRIGIAHVRREDLRHRTVLD